MSEGPAEGEIRIGPSHQARLPDCKTDLPPIEMPEKCEALEELRWAPGIDESVISKITATNDAAINRISDCDLIMYLRAARSMAAFVGMCDGGSPEDGCLAASRDDTTINALELLHENNYDTGKALQALVKNPVPKGIEKKWSEEDQKRFVKGLRQFGKNFFKIKKELLQHKETSELVEFYYLWKKTPQAASTRFHRRHRRQTVLRKIRNSPPATGAQAATTATCTVVTPSTTISTTSSTCATTASVNSASQATNKSSSTGSTLNQRSVTPSDPNDLSSVSDGEDGAVDSDDSASRELNNSSGVHTCSHCSVTASKDWFRDGPNKSIICTECRIFWKKNGTMRPLSELNNQAPPNASQANAVTTPTGATNFLFKPVKEENINPNNHVNASDGMATAANGKPGVRTRQSKTTPGSKSKSKSYNQQVDSSAPVTSPEQADKNGSKSPVPTGPGAKRNAPLSGGVSPKVKRKKNDEDEDDENVEASKLASQGQTHDGMDVDGKMVPGDKSDGQANSPQQPPDNSNDGSYGAVKSEEGAGPEPNSRESTTDSSPANALPMGMDEQSMKSRDSIMTQPPSISSDHLSSEGPGSGLITPKLEPGASPPPPHSSSSSSNSDQLHHQRRLGSSPVRVKQEERPSLLSMPLSAANDPVPPITGPMSTLHPTLSTTTMTTSAVPAIITSSRSQSPSDAPTRGIFPPFMPNPSSMVPSMHAGRPSTQSPSSIREELLRRDSHHEQVDKRSKTPQKEKSSESPRLTPQGQAPPPHHGLSPFLPSSFALPTSLPVSRGHEMFLHPSYTMAGAQSEQRFPPGHPAFGPNPFAMGGHPGAAGFPPGFGFPFAPGLPPYFPHPGWLSPSPRHMAFPPSAPGHPVPAPSPNSSKSKSPVPSRAPEGHHHRSSISSDPGQDRRDSSMDDDEPEPASVISRGPSPDPKVEDSECHRSQSAIFLKHWNRGDFNSCARTDLTFKPVPDSQLARRREERLRKAADKEREEQKAMQRMSNERHGSSSGNDGNQPLNPFDRQTPRGGLGSFTDTPALRQLSEYARPHGAFSPGFGPRSNLGQMPPPQGSPFGIPGLTGAQQMDILQYQMAAGLYGPLARERLEQEEREKREMEKRERELKDFEFKSRMQAAMQSAEARNPMFDAQWMELQRRSGIGGPGGPGPAHANSAAGLPFGMFPPPGSDRDRLGLPPGSSSEAIHNLAMAERMQADRLAAMASDPIMRMQMANLASELQHHTQHAHAHTHLHLHHDPLSMGLPPPGSSNPGASPGLHPSHSLPNPLSGFPPGGPRPSLTRPEMMHASLLRPGMSEQAFADQLNALQQHDMLQRQMMMDRERLGVGTPHPGLLPPGHEEFLRQQHQQRELNMKRSYEEVMRGGGGGGPGGPGSDRR